MFEGWSTLTEQYLGICKSSSWIGTEESRYVSEEPIETENEVFFTMFRALDEILGVPGQKSFGYLKGGPGKAYDAHFIDREVSF